MRRRVCAACRARRRTPERCARGPGPKADGAFARHAARAVERPSAAREGRGRRRSLRRRNRALTGSGHSSENCIGWVLTHRRHARVWRRRWESLAASCDVRLGGDALAAAHLYALRGRGERRVYSCGGSRPTLCRSHAGRSRHPSAVHRVGLDPPASRPGLAKPMEVFGREMRRPPRGRRACCRASVRPGRAGRAACVQLRWVKTHPMQLTCGPQPPLTRCASGGAWPTGVTSGSGDADRSPWPRVATSTSGGRRAMRLPPRIGMPCEGGACGVSTAAVGQDPPDGASWLPAHAPRYAWNPSISTASSRRQMSPSRMRRGTLLGSRRASAACSSGSALASRR